MPLVSLAQRELRVIPGCFATGVAVVTTCGEYSRPVGLAENPFSPLSLDPPEIPWSIVSTAPTRGAFVSRDASAVCVTPEEYIGRILQLACPSDNKLDGVALRRGWRKVPVLDTAIAMSECEVKQTNSSGDHHKIIGFVRPIARRRGNPLAFFHGQFTLFGATA